MKIIMKSAMKVVVSVVMLSGIGTAYANDCASLQSQKNLILASSGYCFNDASLQAQYGQDCHTKRPKFDSDAVRDRFNTIENQLKTMNCPKID
ncbi:MULTISPECIES: YARHG domain-containing protein [unclassified Acinetobacter]|uniref:YARHG domain-containing protein n=1 Tax=unclassified Acinetobacter TaxID=196816 RepID=UPI0035B83059